MRIASSLFLIAILGGAIPSIAGDCDKGGPTCCSSCGCQAACVQKTCQLVCEVKKEKKTAWAVQCEEFCTFLPGKRDCSSDCCEDKLPKCGRQKCVKKLVKKEYEVEKPIYKCVVLYLCPACAGGESSAPVATPLPPAPGVPNVAPAPPAPLPPAPKSKNVIH